MKKLIKNDEEYNRILMCETKEEYAKHEKLWLKWSDMNMNYGHDRYYQDIIGENGLEKADDDGDWLYYPEYELSYKNIKELCPVGSSLEQQRNIIFKIAGYKPVIGIDEIEKDYELDELLTRINADLFKLKMINEKHYLICIERLNNGQIVTRGMKEGKF